MARDEDQQKPNRPKQNTAPAGTHLNAYQQASLLGQMVPVTLPGSTSPKAKSAAGQQGAFRSRRGKRQHARPEGDIIGPNDEIIFERATRGAFTQISAMHVPTLTEVSAVGSAQASEFELQQLALAKLRFVLRKKLGEGS